MVVSYVVVKLEVGSVIVHGAASQSKRANPLRRRFGHWDMTYSAPNQKLPMAHFPSGYSSSRATLVHSVGVEVPDG